MAAGTNNRSIPRSASRANGFTLIELLVVVAIIALLIGILVPSLSQARDTAKTTSCLSNIRQWGMGFNLYEQTNNNDLPNDGDNGNVSTKPMGPLTNPYMWYNGIPQQLANGQRGYGDIIKGTNNNANGGMPNVGKSSIFICPAASEVGGSSTDTVTNSFFQTYFYDDSVTPVSNTTPYTGTAFNMLMCYGMNSQLRNTTLSASSKFLWPPTSKSTDIRKFEQVEPQQEVVVFAEKRISPNEISPTDTGYSSFVTSALTQSKIAPTRVALRHKVSGKKAATYAFADAHGETVPWETSIAPRVAASALNGTTPPGGTAVVAGSGLADPTTGAQTDYNLPGFVWNPNLATPGR